MIKEAVRGVSKGLFIVGIVGAVLLLVRCISYAEDMLPMPKGLKGVQLGMSVNALQKIKPNIKKDDWPYSPLFFEKDLDNTYFSSVVYKFLDGRLSSVELSSAGTHEVSQNKIAGLIKGCIKKWGTNYLKKIGIGEDIRTKKVRLHPFLYWPRGDAHIFLTYSTKMYSIRIVDSQQKTQMKFRDPLDSKEIEELFKDVPIAENYEGPIFE